MLTSNLSKNSRVFINLLADLSEKDRTILIERFVRNKSMKEMAEQFQVSDARIKEIEDNLIRQIEQKFDFSI